MRETFTYAEQVEQLGESMVKTIWIGDVQKGQYNGQEVELKGWVKRERGSNKLRFIVLRDSTGSIQCVGKFDVLGAETFADLKAILIETSVVFQGTVITSEDAPGGHELQITSMEIVGAVNSERPFPITESTLKVVDEEGLHFMAARNSCSITAISTCVLVGKQPC